MHFEDTGNGCSNSWDIRDASVVCRQLGYKAAGTCGKEYMKDDPACTRSFVLRAPFDIIWPRINLRFLARIPEFYVACM